MGPNNQLSYAIYINNKDAGFEFAVAGLLPVGAGQVTFADMDGDGAVDMVVPACDNRGQCSIYVYYNQQMPLCTSKDEKNCRQVTNLCVADPSFTFSPDPDHNNNPGALVQFPLDEVLPDNQRLLLVDPGFKGVLPVSVHVGDYNLDGYPDLLIVSGTPGNNNRASSATLLQSVLCRSDNGCALTAVDAKRRSFIKVTEGANELNSLQDVRAAAFLDLDEDVRFRFRNQCEVIVRPVSNLCANCNLWFLLHFIPSGYCGYYGSPQQQDTTGSGRKIHYHDP